MVSIFKCADYAHESAELAVAGPHPSLWINWLGLALIEPAAGCSRWPAVESHHLGQLNQCRTGNLRGRERGRDLEEERFIYAYHKHKSSQVSILVHRLEGNKCVVSAKVAPVILSSAAKAPPRETPPVVAIMSQP